MISWMSTLKFSETFSNDTSKAYSYTDTDDFIEETLSSSEKENTATWYKSGFKYTSKTQR